MVIPLAKPGRQSTIDRKRETRSNLAARSADRFFRVSSSQRGRHWRRRRFLATKLVKHVPESGLPKAESCDRKTSNDSLGDLHVDRDADGDVVRERQAQRGRQGKRGAGLGDGQP